MNPEPIMSLNEKSSIINILIVDDHPIIRQSLAGMINAYGPPFVIIGAAKSPEEALVIIESDPPDVVLMDLHMPSMSGFKLIESLRGRYPNMRFLVFTASFELEYILQAFDVGAHGFIVKDAESAEILRAIEVVSEGYTHFPADLARFLCMRERKPKLTEREQEVLNLLADGMTSKEIAKALGIDHRTIETYRAKIRQKFGLESSAALLRFAIDNKRRV